MKSVFRNLITALLASTFLVRFSVADLCKADEAQDAVELLFYALKCAIKPSTGEVFGHVELSLTIHKFTGNARQLIVEEEKTWDDGTVLNRTVKANFAELDDRVTTIELNDTPTADVYIVCANNRACIDLIVRKFELIEICDLAEAKHAKLAIETLIRFNRSVSVEADLPASAPPSLSNKASIPKKSGTNDNLFDDISDLARVPPASAPPSVSKKTSNSDKSAPDDNLFDTQPLIGPR